MISFTDFLSAIGFFKFYPGLENSLKFLNEKTDWTFLIPVKRNKLPHITEELREARNAHSIIQDL